MLVCRDARVAALSFSFSEEASSGIGGVWNFRHAVRDNDAGQCQPRRIFDQLFESVVDGFTKFGRHDDSLDDAVALLIGQASEVCRRSVTLPDLALHNARPDSK